MTNEGREPWAATVDAFPRASEPADQVRFLLNYAVLAPSSHNSQPWRFRVDETSVDLLGDPARRLNVVDPDGRELRISCGAALFHLRSALAYFGMPHLVELLPDPAEPDLLARIRLDRGAVPDLPETLFQAIPQRRTNRAAFQQQAPPPAEIAALNDAAEAEGAWFHQVTGDQMKTEIADLIAAGDRQQWADPAFRRELASWMHPSRTRSRDGMPGFALEEGALESLVAPLLVRTFDLGSGRAASDRHLATAAPVLAVLGTAADRPVDHLRAGQALARLFLQATAAGLSISFLNQPIEVPALRPRLAATIGRTGWPHLLMRIGVGPAGPHTPRRPVSDVLIPADT